MSDNDLILRVAARGDGVTGEGLHVPFSAPGDRLNAHGGLIHGPHHAEPPCQHFQLCGGCQLQHLDDESLAAFVRDGCGMRWLANRSRRQRSCPCTCRHRDPAPGCCAFGMGGRQFQLGFSTEKSHRIIDLRNVTSWRQGFSR